MVSFTGRDYAASVRSVTLGVFLLVLISTSLLFPLGRAVAGESAVILIYHRFGEEAYPSTNIRLEQFEQQIKILQENGYHVLPLSEIISSLRAGTPLPDKAIAITIDDAFSSVYAEAWPRLKAAGFPFTLFVATGPVDNNLQGYMNWDQIREMRDGGVTIGGHTVSHLHMPNYGRERNVNEISVSNRRFEEELGERPSLFAFPFGEASLDLMGLVAESGYTAAFGQHSGVADRHSDPFYLPRFPVNETYGDDARFRRVINALSLPVQAVTPSDPLIAENNPPAFGFSVVGDVPRLNELACYHSVFGKVQVEQLGDARFEVRFTGPFPSGRTRLNCTVPAQEGRWRWFGTQFYVSPD